MTESEVIIAYNAGSYKQIDDLFAALDFDNESYPNLINIVTPALCTKAEFKQRVKDAQRLARITAALGTVPANPHELVEAVATVARLLLDETDHQQPVSWIDPLTQRRQKLNEQLFIEACKDVNRNIMGSTFNRIDVTDQCGYFLMSMNEALRERICAKLSPDVRPAFDWMTFVTTMFDQSTQDAEMQAAILQKWIWMVKRRLNGLPVTHHICPVIFGSQGCGKTVTVERMYAPLGALATRADLSRLADTRDAGIFESYVVFFDEMSKADRAEMTAVKDAITRDSLSFRPMNTNINAKKDQNASFIGTSNKLLAQVINDPTGNRRFVELHFNSDARQTEWDYCNSVDFTAMWQSVDHTAEDPSKPYWNDIKQEQLQHRTQSTVEQFISYLVDNDGQFVTGTVAGSPMHTGIKLGAHRWTYFFNCYREHGKFMHMSHALELQGFMNEVRRLMRENGSALALRSKRAPGGAFNGLEYTGPVRLALVTPEAA